MVEEPGSVAGRHEQSAVAPVLLSEVPSHSEERFSAGIAALDRVLGGGVVPGSLVLVGGEPGIGKSTLLLQLCGDCAKAGLPVLYVSGEESPRQIRLRAQRLKVEGQILLYAENSMEGIEAAIRKQSPALVVVDSIQTVHHPELGGAPGSVGQVRECAARLQTLAKGQEIPIFLVGHVTKDGAIAGPRVLEHLVDTVLYFEGEKEHQFRILRTVKNRFGPAHEVAVFSMDHAGLKEVVNPSEAFLSGRIPGASGSATACVLEGTQPLLVELQALVGRSYYGVPQRVCTGVDSRRLSMLLAVIEKNAKITMGTQDVFLNVVGGFRLNETCADLGILSAIFSSCLDAPMPEKTAFLGEVGLAGEIRPVGRLNLRLKEAERMGFDEIVLPQQSLSAAKGHPGLRMIPVRTVLELAEWIRTKKRKDLRP